jgi:hypothetical protein
MFRNKYFLACLCLASAAATVVACASKDDSSSESGSADLSASGAPKQDPAVVGSWEDKSQTTQDFGTVEFRADGTYSAQVINTVAAHKVLCARAPCNAPETGKWHTIPRQLLLTPDDGPGRGYIFNIGTDGKLNLIKGDALQQLEPVKETCESLGGECKSDPNDVTFPAVCDRDFGTLEISGTCKAINQACCSKTSAEPARTCESLGGECKSDPNDVGFPAVCDRDFGTKQLSGTCKAINQQCCSK